MSKERWMEDHKHYIRGDEDSTSCNLVLWRIPTGAIYLSIYDLDTAEQMMVGFTNAIGGGCSPNVYKALESLALAVEEDNEKCPITIVRPQVTPEQFQKNRFILNERRMKRDKKQDHR